eukprot:COSAG01_NODE_9724_length_2361_cov_4.078249_2_plen_205_part_00
MDRPESHPQEPAPAATGQLLLAPLMPIYQFRDALTGDIETVDSADKLRAPHARRLRFYGDPEQAFTDDTHTKLRTFPELKAVLKSQGIKQKQNKKGVSDGLSDSSDEALCRCTGTCGATLLSGSGKDRAAKLTTHRDNFRRANPAAPAEPFQLMCGPCADAAAAAAAPAASNANAPTRSGQVTIFSQQPRNNPVIHTCMYPISY